MGQEADSGKSWGVAASQGKILIVTQAIGLQKEQAN